MTALRYLIAPVRVLVLLLHVIDGIAISGLVVPLIDQRQRKRTIGTWSRVLLRICGSRLVVTGRPLDPDLARYGTTPGAQGRMFLCNHISWIDVFALLGAMPVRFVAK